MPNADDVSDPTPDDVDTPDVDDAAPNTADTAAITDDVDLDAVERDLAAVEIALSRLADGTYWTDEVTGEPLTDDVLTHDPLARRV